MLLLLSCLTSIAIAIIFERTKIMFEPQKNNQQNISLLLLILNNLRVQVSMCDLMRSTPHSSCIFSFTDHIYAICSIFCPQFAAWHVTFVSLWFIFWVNIIRRRATQNISMWTYSSLENNEIQYLRQRRSDLMKLNWWFVHQKSLTLTHSQFYWSIKY